MVEFNPEKHVKTPEKPCISCGSIIRSKKPQSKKHKFGKCIACNRKNAGKQGKKRREELLEKKLEVANKLNIEFRKSNKIKINRSKHKVGVPCLKCGCHIKAKSNGRCINCKKNYDKEIAENKKEYFNEKAKNWLRKNPDRARAIFDKRNKKAALEKNGIFIRKRDVEIISMERLIQVMGMTGLSSADFSRKLGFSRDWINQILRGDDDIGYKTSIAVEMLYNNMTKKSPSWES